MAAAFVNCTELQSTSQSASGTVTATAGHALIAVILEYGPSNTPNYTVTGGGTWTTDLNGTSSNTMGVGFASCASATGGSATVTVTSTAAGIGTTAYILEFSGMLSSGMYEGPASGTACSSGTSTTPTTSALTNTAADAVKIAGAAFDAGDNLAWSSTGTGWTMPPTNGSEPDGSSFLVSACAYKIVSASQSDTEVWSRGSSNPWVAHIATYLATSGGPSPVSGSGGLTISHLTLSGTGAETFSGSGSPSISHPTLSGSGSLDAPGTAAISMSHPTLSATGLVANTVSGSGALTISTPLLAATAQLTILGTGAISVSHPTLNGFSSRPFIAAASANGRYMVDQSSQPIFIQGDSPQSMLSHFTTTEMSTFFSGQALRSYNASQIHLILSDVNGMTGNSGGVDVNGVAPFSSMSTLAGPNAAYWNNVDAMLTLAQQNGITVFAGVPDNISMGPTIEGMTLAQCNTLGQFLGNRYKNLPNIIWQFGNDYAPPLYAARDAKYREILVGIRAAGDTHLVTYWGDTEGSSWENSAWDTLHALVLDYAYTVPYYQSELAWQDTSPGSPQPNFFGEGNYEFEHLSGYSGIHTTTNETLRRTAWWSVTWGACGQFFGQQAVWKGETYGGPGTPAHYWPESVTTTAASENWRVATLLRSLSWWKLQPDFSQTLITAGVGTHDTSEFSDPLANDYATAAISTDGLLAVIYVPTVRSWTINTSVLTGSLKTGYWFDPTTGTTTAAAAPWTIPATAHADGTHDWVLVLQGSSDTTGTGAITIGHPSLSGTVLETISGTVDISISHPLLSGSGSMASGAQTLSPNTITTAEQVHAPVVNLGTLQSVLPDTISSAANVYVVTLNLTVGPSTIATGETLYAPTVFRAIPQTVTPATITTAQNVYAAAVGFVVPGSNILPAVIASLARVYSPTVNRTPRGKAPSLKPYHSPSGPPFLTPVT